MRLQLWMIVWFLAIIAGAVGASAINLRDISVHLKTIASPPNV